MPVGQSGAELFERVYTGNGVFTTGVTATNSGSGSIDLGAVTGANAVTGHDYQIAFAVTAGVTTYSVIDNTTATTLSSGNTYTPGAAITFDGLQMSVSGAPDNGDSFSVAPSARQSVFATLANAISLLETASPQASATPKMNVGMMQTMASIDSAFKQLQTTHTEVGAGLAELDVLSSVSANMTVIYGEQQSKQVGIDYAAAISELTIGQQALTAAQQSYAMVTKLSLFNYL
jgi:flagellar hook-associated protein 3 FlgL